MGIRKIDVEKVATAIEADACEALPDLRQAREKSGLMQAAFADRIKTSVATLRDWEQGRFVPPDGVLCLFRLIVKHPDLLKELAA